MTFRAARYWASAALARVWIWSATFACTTLVKEDIECQPSVQPLIPPFWESLGFSVGVPALIPLAGGGDSEKLSSISV